MAALNSMQASTGGALPVCPVCGQPTHHGRIHAEKFADREGPIMCGRHGVVGIHNHYSKENKMYSVDAIRIAHEAAGGTWP